MTHISPIVSRVFPDRIISGTSIVAAGKVGLSVKDCTYYIHTVNFKEKKTM